MMSIETAIKNAENWKLAHDKLKEQNAALLREVAELRAKVSELERTLALQQKSAELLFESQQALARRREKENRK
jgi:chromosome condensin MukBEF ATPase and DNA-binding subunit MukB